MTERDDTSRPDETDAGTDEVLGASAPGADPAEKDPSDWVTGDEPMTGAQASYLQTLSEEAGEAFDRDLTKAQASERIEELQRTTGRGRSDDGPSKAKAR